MYTWRKTKTTRTFRKNATLSREMPPLLSVLDSGDDDSIYMWSSRPPSESSMNPYWLLYSQVLAKGGYSIHKPYGLQDSRKLVKCNAHYNIQENILSKDLSSWGSFYKHLTQLMNHRLLTYSERNTSDLSRLESQKNIKRDSHVEGSSDGSTKSTMCPLDNSRKCLLFGAGQPKLMTDCWNESSIQCLSFFLSAISDLRRGIGAGHSSAWTAFATLGLWFMTSSFQQFFKTTRNVHSWK